MNIDKIATSLNISKSTIKNWLKIYEDSSLDDLAKQKLTKRANKSQKDTHNHQALSEAILSNIDIKDINKLSDEYENSLSNSYKNKEGIYYTPYNVVKDFFNLTPTNEDTFCDPCCGSGNFIVRAIELGFKPQNIYGFDTDPIAVELTKKRIYQLTGYKTKNIFHTDFLKEYQNYSFDYIYTNPPWGKKLPLKEKEKLAKKFNTNKDTISFFFCAILEITKQKFGLILPESFFNITTFENVRKKALKYHITKIIDYQKPFKLLTSTQGIEIAKSKPNKTLINNSYTISQTIFNSNPKHIFNFYATKEDIEVLKHIFSIPHKKLKDNAIWGLGIVTGDNKKFLSSYQKEGFEPIFRGSDILKDRLKEPSNFFEPDLSKYQQTAPLSMYKAKEKIIYRFISSKLVFFYDTKQRFILNSANLLITKNFPLPMKTLTQFLNSNFINWVFQKLFKTNKILRSDLELIPIHTQFIGKEFDEKSYLENLGIKEINGTYRIRK